LVNVNGLTLPQQQVVALPFDQGQRVFVHGPAGSGKTTALQQRLVSLLAAGVPSYTLLALLPETSAALKYQEAMAAAGLGPYSDLHLTTLPKLARELVTLFWPLLARPAGFAAPHRPPTFLSYDLAQVQMKRVIAPLREEGYFEGLWMRPQQILSQLLDNLNRAALNGLTLDQMEDRLVRTWSGDPDHVRYFHQAACAARRFRQSCLDANLLDLSLVVDLFQRHLLDHPLFAGYFPERYRHLLVDNLEEMPPAGLAFLRMLLPGRNSAVLAYDDGGGYKRYLAADPASAREISALCDETVAMPDSLTTSPPLQALSRLVERRLTGRADLRNSAAEKAVIHVIKPRYRREMIQETVALITESLILGPSPSQIAIITPYLDGALRYRLTQALAAAGVPYRLLQRRGSPRDEPLVRAWLTLAALAHPHWGMAPSEYDVAEGLALAVNLLDRPRAALAARLLYDPSGPGLRSIDMLGEEELARLGPEAAERIGKLQNWLERWPGTEPLDRFLGYLFGDLLSSPHFQPAPDVRAAAVCHWLVKTAEQFRRAAPGMGLEDVAQQGRVFIESVREGMVTGIPLPALVGDTRSEGGIIIATLYAYLLTGPAVEYQIWLEAGATGWWEIPRQPLSNAFVLTPRWNVERPWTEVDSFSIRNRLLARLVSGLCARCSKGVVLSSSDLDRRGERQDGPLWRALAPLLSLWKPAA
jgi:hypothetical protein